MAAKLYGTIKKLEESIEAEKTNQATAKTALNRLATERQTHQAVVNDKHKTSDEIEQAKTELKRIEDERKAADKQFRDSTTTLTSTRRKIKLGMNSRQSWRLQLSTQPTRLWSLS